jgi:hypothetical protein
MNAFWRVFTRLSRVYLDLYNKTDVEDWPQSSQALMKCVKKCTEDAITFSRDELKDQKRFKVAALTMRRCGLVRIKNRVSEELSNKLLKAQLEFQNTTEFKDVKEYYSDWSREYEGPAAGRSDFWLPAVSPFNDTESQQMYTDELIVRLTREYFKPLKQNFTLANMRIFTIEPVSPGVAMHVDTSVMKSQIATFTALTNWTQSQSAPKWCPCLFQDPFREMGKGLPPHDLHSMALSDGRNGYSGVQFAGTLEGGEFTNSSEEIKQLRHPLNFSDFTRCFQSDGVEWVHPGVGDTTIYDVTLPHETRSNSAEEPRPNFVVFYHRDGDMPTRSKYTHGQEDHDLKRKDSVVKAQDFHIHAVAQAVKRVVESGSVKSNGAAKEL